jgi:glycosyltransferase involved in cell wall biosynthesis
VPNLTAAERIAAREQILRSTGWATSSTIATFIGTLREKKGVHTLLLAMAALPKDSLIRLLVVGPPLGNLERRICGELWDRLVAEGRVWYTGRIKLDEVSQWSTGADLVVMPSLDDGMANGLLEGMALGLCPVATEIFADVVDNGENGVEVTSADPMALASALQHLANNPAEVERMRSAARASMIARTPDYEAQAYLDLFDEVMQAESEVSRNHG